MTSYIRHAINYDDWWYIKIYFYALVDRKLTHDIQITVTP